MEMACAVSPSLLWLAHVLYSQLNPPASMLHKFNFSSDREIKQHISVKSSLHPGFRPHSPAGLSLAQNPLELCFPPCDVLSSTFKKQGYVSFALSTCK